MYRTESEQKNPRQNYTFGKREKQDNFSNNFQILINYKKAKAFYPANVRERTEELLTNQKYPQGIKLNVMKSSVTLKSRVIQNHNEGIIFYCLWLYAF